MHVYHTSMLEYALLRIIFSRIAMRSPADTACVRLFGILGITLNICCWHIVLVEFLYFAGTILYVRFI